MTTPRPITDVRAVKVRPGRWTELPDQVATEEPMQIQVAGPGQEPSPLAVTMRTPGHDFELAAGFVVSEAVAAPAEIASVSYCDAPRDTPDRYNTVTVRLTRAWDDAGQPRRFAASASCGVCGKTSIDDVVAACRPVPPASPIPAAIISELPDRLRTAQRVFDRTGGLHAAGLFAPTGEPWCSREDVGRHNAVDKVIGSTVIGAARPPDGALAGWVLMVSGRVSFEIVQKAALGGIGTIAAVSAPTSLAVDAAERLGVALLAFVRDGSFGIYAHPERVQLPDD